MYISFPTAVKAAKIVAGMGVSKIVKGIIQTNVPIFSRTDSLKVWAGSMVLSSMMIEQSSNHIERGATKLVMFFENRKEEEEEEKDEPEE